ncbi:MAG: hypothetical protein JWQ27_1096 [Ferruginibacter sp.]|nr:hypothetical protein [Ferruginibacter sp.]
MLHIRWLFFFILLSRGAGQLLDFMKAGKKSAAAFLT